MIILFRVVVRIMAGFEREEYLGVDKEGEDGKDIVN
jgi:hypothetical protein